MTEELQRNQNTHLRPVDWTRRRFIQRSGLTMAGLAAGMNFNLRPARGATAAGGRPDLNLLESSPFVYISPLKSDGKESSCHAEVWFAWLDDSIVITVAADRWKATALRRGLDRARIWVGPHGRWKTMVGGRNEDFLDAPNFIARAERVGKEDKTLIDRLLGVYEKKYPEEIGRWRDGMRSGNADGSRILIRYRHAATSQ